MTSEGCSSPNAPEPWRAVHDEADAAGHDGYFDPLTGLFVMTKGFLIRRGTCCSSGCRHCPYNDGLRAQHPDDQGAGG